MFIKHYLQTIVYLRRKIIDHLFLGQLGGALDSEGAKQDFESRLGRFCFTIFFAAVYYTQTHTVLLFSFYPLKERALARFISPSFCFGRLMLLFSLLVMYPTLHFAGERQLLGRVLPIHNLSCSSFYSHP